MNQQQMIDDCKKYTMYTWAATEKVDPLPISHCDGVYMYGPEGQKWLDFNSQLMSVNVGHNHPKIIAAIKEQADQLIYTYPGTATEIRAKLGKRLAELMPGDLNTSFFCLGGAEANENAIKMVRQVTGRFKILSRYRSYHGATNATMQLTGDPRRIPNEPGAPGFVHVMDPWPRNFDWGDNDEEITARNLVYLEEVIQYEGPTSIAAMFIETVTGTNGILPPPKGYLKGLRALLDKYGIMLVCDEVMAGFGRTGKLMAFEHGDIVPDVVTVAKGLTSSYVPLGACIVNDKIARYFDNNVFWGGLTYNSHALCLGAALAAVDALIEDGCVENAARLDPILRGHMERMKAKHPSVRTHRNIGLFGIMELQKPGGERIAPYNGSHPLMNEMAAYFKDNGLFTFVRWDGFMCNPPLCITEAQLDEGFAIIDKALDIPDQLFR